MVVAAEEAVCDYCGARLALRHTIGLFGYRVCARCLEYLASVVRGREAEDRGGDGE